MIRSGIAYGEIGYGYVVIPKDVDREVYINNCYGLGSCVLFVEDIGFLTDVKIGGSIINLIEFPDTPDGFGSILAYMKTPRYRNYLAFEIVKSSDKSYAINEYEFSLGKDKGSIRAFISGNSNKGALLMGVSGGKAKMGISLVNSSKDAALDIMVSGKITQDSISSSCRSQEGQEYLDDVSIDLKVKTSEISITEDIIDYKIKDTELSMTNVGFKLKKLGYGIKKTLQDIINEMIAFKTVSPGGNGLTDPGTIVNLQGYLAELDNYLED